MKNALSWCALALAATGAFGQMPRMGRPPVEAFSACEGRTEGAACRFDAPHGLVQGECRTMREGRPVCVPAGNRGGDGPQSGAEIAGRNPKAIRVESRLPDTNQGSCFDNGGAIPCPPAGSPT